MDWSNLLRPARELAGRWRVPCGGAFPPSSPRGRQSDAFGLQHDVSCCPAWLAIGEVTGTMAANSTCCRSALCWARWRGFDQPLQVVVVTSGRPIGLYGSGLGAASNRSLSQWVMSTM